MPETPATTPAEPVMFPAGRYGRRREPRRTPRLLIAVLALLVVAGAGWIGSRLYVAYGDGDYTGAVTKFGDIADDRVTITVMVRLPEDGTAICTLRARNEAGAEIGRQEVLVKAGSDPSRTIVSHTLMTSDRPVTGELQGCRPE